MRRAIRRTTGLLRGSVAALVAVTMISACAGSTSDTRSDGSAVTVGTTPSSERPTGPPVPGGSLVYGISAETNSLNPYFGQWAASAYIVGNAIYEPLAALTTDGTVKPYLAESITPNVDFTEWTIRLRPGVTFHDGEELDAAAVVGNIDYARRSALTGAILEPIRSATAVDDSTVMVAMKTPWSTFPQVLTAQVGYMAAPADAAGFGPGDRRSRRDRALRVQVATARRRRRGGEEPELLAVGPAAARRDHVQGPARRPRTSAGPGGRRHRRHGGDDPRRAGDLHHQERRRGRRSC